MLPTTLVARDSEPAPATPARLGERGKASAQPVKAGPFTAARLASFAASGIGHKSGTPAEASALLWHVGGRLCREDATQFLKKGRRTYADALQHHQTSLWIADEVSSNDCARCILNWFVSGVVGLAQNRLVCTHPGGNSSRVSS